MSLNGKNINGALFNQTPTIVGQAAAKINDVRCRVLKFDANGNLALATAGTDIPVGIALIEEGANDITGAESGKVEAGDDVTVLIKDIGFALAGADITKGQELTASTGGTVVPASAGNYVIGFALATVESGGIVKIQLAKYQKNA